MSSIPGSGDLSMVLSIPVYHSTKDFTTQFSLNCQKTRNIYSLIEQHINPWSANLHNLNFYLELSRYRDPQLQVGENDSYLFNSRPTISNVYVKTVISFPPVIWSANSRA